MTVFINFLPIIFRYFYSKIILIFIAILYSNTCFSHGISRDDLHTLSKAYGYMYSRELCATYIKKHYQNLNNEVDYYNLSWEDRFPALKNNLLKHLQCFGLTEKQLIASMKAEKKAYNSMLSRLPKSENEALNLLQDYYLRLSEPNEFDKKIYATFNDVIYNDHPEMEFQRKVNQIQFSTNGHPKSNGINLQISLPSSWLQEEGKRPHIVQKWSKADEDSYLILMITIVEKDQDISNDDFVKAVTNEINSGQIYDLFGILRDELLSINKAFVTKIEQIPCVYFDANAKVHRLNTTSFSRVNSLFFPFMNSYILVNLSIYNSDLNKTNQIFSKYSSLKDMIFNSIVLPQIYY